MSVTTPSRLAMPKLPRREKTGVPRSQAERLWLIGGGLVALVLFLIGYFFFISPQRTQTADVNSQVTTTQDQNTVLQNRIDMLREQNKDLGKWQAELAQARLALPTTSGVSDFLRSLQSLGNATLTDVTALSVGTPVDVTSLPGFAPAAATAPTDAAAAPADSASSAPAAAAPAPAATSVIYALPISATVTGSPAALAKFLDQLQAVQPRAVLITSIDLGSAATTPGATAAVPGQTSLKINMQAYVAPNTPSESASLSAASH